MPEALWQPLVLGGISGTVGELVAQPMIVVRTRMMVQGIGGVAMRYNGFWDCCRTMLLTEGPGAFYKGAAANAAFTPACRALYMGGLEFSHATIGVGTPARDFAAGAAAQLIGSLAYVPRDIIVERCAIDGQLQRQEGSCSSSLEALRTIASREGLRGFGRAYMPHQLVWIPYNGLFFALLGRLEAGQGSPSFGMGVLNSAVCAAAAGWATTPIDVVKTRVQVQGADPQLFAFKGPLDCARQLVQKEGPAALFSGATGRMLYLVPSMSIFVPLYELLKRLTA